MSRARKTFAVRFSETNYYTLRVKAGDQQEAEQKVFDLYHRHGPKKRLGFIFDLTEGRSELVDAEEVHS